MKLLLRVLIVAVVGIPFGKLFGGLFLEIAHTPELLTFEIIRNGSLIFLVWVIVLAPLIWLHNRVPSGGFDIECPHCSRLVNRWRPHRCFDGQRRRP